MARTAGGGARDLSTGTGPTGGVWLPANRVVPDSIFTLS
jgi:hypothetical protein